MSDSMERLLVGGNVVTTLAELEQRLRQLERRSIDQGGGRVFVDGWRRTDVAANLSAATMNRFAETADAAFQLPVGCFVTGLFASLNAARTNGTLDVVVYVAGVAAEMDTTFDEDVTQYSYKPGRVSVEAGEEVTVRLTSSNDWTPTTADLKVGLMIEVPV